MQQVSESEFDCNLIQLASMVPIELIEDRHGHGMVYGNVIVSYLDEREFLLANPKQRLDACRRAYIRCLRTAIDQACDALDELSNTGRTKHLITLSKQVTASIEKGHAVLTDGADLDLEVEDETST